MLKNSVVYIKIDVVKYSSIYENKQILNRTARGTGYCISTASPASSSKLEDGEDDKLYIVTNWHVINDNVNVYIRDPHEEKYFKTKVLIECPYIDLAILECPKELNLKPLELAELPSLMEECLIYGFPIDGYNLTATKGVISRFETVSVTGLEWISYLSLRLDVSAYFGNSGGPVLNSSGKVIGTVNASNISIGHVTYCMPSFFVKNIILFRNNATEMPICSLGVKTQKLTNSMKKYYGFDGAGILVTSLDSVASNTKVKEEDILISVNGKHINDNGMLKLSDFLPLEKNCDLDTYVYFNFYIGLLKPNDKVVLELFRDKAIISETIILEKMNEPIALKNNRFYTHSRVSDESKIYTFAPLSRYGITELEECRDFILRGYKSGQEMVLLSVTPLGSVAIKDTIKNDDDDALDCKHLIVKSVDDVKVRDFAHFIETLDIKNIKKNVKKIKFRKCSNILILS